MKKFFLFLLFFLGNCSNKCMADFTVDLASPTTPLTALDSSSLHITKLTVSSDLSASTPGFEHEETFNSNAWLGILSTDVNNNYLEYSFLDPAPQIVTRISFWNITDTSDVFSPSGAPPGYVDPLWNRTSGINSFKLLRAENYGTSTVSWTEVGVFSLQKANGGTYLDTTYGSLYYSQEQAITSFAPFLTNAVRIQILSNHGNTDINGDSIVGLAAVNFFSVPPSTAVPEPTSLCLFGGSVILAGAYRRFRRRSSKGGKSNLAL